MKKDFEIKIEKNIWEECIDKAFDKKKKDIKIDGFRKGSVSKEVFIKKAGVESLYMDALDEALPLAYRKLMEDNKDLVPAVMPSYDVKTVDENGVTFNFEVVLKPEVKLGKYKDLGIKKDEASVTSEEVDNEIEMLKNQFVELKEKTGKVASGDVTFIDFEGFKDGKAFEGGKGEDYRLEIGSHSFIPGFEEGIVGMELNETKDLNLKFPEDYHAEDLKGADVVFKVTVKKINEKIYPEMDEDFFKDLNIPEVDTEEKLRNFIESNIKMHKEQEIESAHVEACLEEAVKNAEFEVPEEMVSEETNRMLNEFSEQLKMQGFELNQYLNMLNMDEEALKGNFKEEATKRVNYRLVIEEVAKAEKFEITEEELDKHVTELAARYGAEESEFLKQVGGKDFIKFDLEFKKAIEVISK